MDEALRATANIDVTTLEIDREVPLDYESLVAGAVQVVFFGEEHTYEGLIRDLAANAAALKAGGINVFLLEAPEDQDFTDINNGDFSRIGEMDLGPDLDDVHSRSEDSAERQEIITNGNGVRQAREELVKALVGAGIPVFPIDEAKQSANTQADHENRAAEIPTPIEVAAKEEEERENSLVSNIVQKTKDFGKSGVLIGEAHAWRGHHYHYYGRPDLHQVPTAQAVEDANLSVRTVRFTDIAPTRVLPGVARPGAKEELDKYMYRPSSHPANFDLLANVPPTEQQARLNVIDHQRAS